MNRAWHVLLGGLAALAACDGPSPGDKLDPLARGVADPGHLEVGRLDTATGLCTATLIGRQTLLTAAHCAPGKGSTWKTSTGFFIESAVLHPGYTGVAINDPDLAVARLTKRAYGLHPAWIATEPPTVGEPILLVGFGGDETGAYTNSRRSGPSTIASVAGPIFEFDDPSPAAAICRGDSGGPSYATPTGAERLAGVHARALPCSSGLSQGIDVRADLYRDWIVSSAMGDVYDGGAIDVDPPSVAIAEPADGATVPPSFAVEVAVADAALAQIELFLDGTKVADATATPLAYLVVDAALGAHGLRAVARDAEGNEAEASIEVTVAASSRAAACVAETCRPAQGGCVQAGPGAPGCSLLLALAALAWVTRRATRGAPLR